MNNIYNLKSALKRIKELEEENRELVSERERYKQVLYNVLRENGCVMPKALLGQDYFNENECSINKAKKQYPCFFRAKYEK